MKKFFIYLFFIWSFQGNASSYLILNNGVTLTTDQSGMIFDFAHFIAPYKITASGGQFFLENNKLHTIDTNGFLYEKDIKVDKIKGKGINYIITENKLITIDAKGFFYEFSKDIKSILKKSFKFGGSFFLAHIDEKKNLAEMFTVNDSGQWTNVRLDGLEISSINIWGGKYFQTLDGSLYTISSNGFVFNKKDFFKGEISRKGGRFFITDKNLLYTISDDGILLSPSVPSNFDPSAINKLGVNYMIDTKGNIFTVDQFGNVHTRKVEHDLLNTKIISF